MAVLKTSINLSALLDRNDTGDKRLADYDAARAKENEPPYPSDMPGSLAVTSEAVAKMMRLWNYREGSGLGAQGQGIVAPIQPTMRRQNAGIGHREEPYDNGLHAPPPPPVEDEWHRQWEERSRALRCEEECYEKILALLRDRKLQGDDSAETADALAAIIKSKELFRPGERAPGTWKATLPPSTSRYTGEQVITPWLAAEVQPWQPSWDPDCYHWLRPWIPLIGHLPGSLYDAVESKISGGDYDTISPWKAYLDPTLGDVFAQRHVLPRLTRLLRELRITPPKQIDGSFRAVMLWAPLVHARDVVPILEAEFFDRWEGALRHWLRSRIPSLGEATAWYTGWKNLFTPELLADERVLAHLEAGVGMVNVK